MKCYICDATLGQDEIKLTPEYGRGGLAPCGRCDDVISEVFAEGADNNGMSLGEFMDVEDEQEST